MDPSQVFSCMIVDDDEIDRLTVLAHLRQYPFIQVRGVYGSALEAAEHLRTENIHLLLLDVEMPEISGIDLRMQFLEVPACIFITSHPDFALEGFDASALDYIVKPFSPERFGQAMQRAREYLEIREKAAMFEYATEADTISIKEGYERTKVRLQDILYLEALKDYTSVVTSQRKYCVLATLGNLLQESQFQTFIRIHRSFAVQKHLIHKVDTRNVYLGETTLPLGRTFKKEVDDLFE